jgi:hypothetical protein
MKAVLQTPFAVLATALLATAAAVTPAAALDQGRFDAGLYTAPGELFSVRSPLGPKPHLVDSFDRTTGAVTFFDETGQLYGVICTPSVDVLAGADNDFETDAAILRNWLHDATFPLFFERQLPGARIVNEGPGTFEGKPAWIATLHLPRGSSMLATDPESGETVRQDSYRGLVVFSRGEHTYLLMIESPPAVDWNVFLPQLTDFYRGMRFAAERPLNAENPALAYRSPGT